MWKYISAGLVAGILIGNVILPSVLPRSEPSIPLEELQARHAHQHQLEAELAETLVRLDGIIEARIHLAVRASKSRKERTKASVTLALADMISDEQIASIAHQVAASVVGLDPGDIRIIDTSGRLLNIDALQHQERRQFWIGIAVNVAKVLGILAALITLRFVIQAFGKTKS